MKHPFKSSFKTVKLKFGSEARGAIVRGIKKLADTATLTLGPGVYSISGYFIRGGMSLLSTKAGSLRLLRME